MVTMQQAPDVSFAWMPSRPVFHPGLGRFFVGLREQKGWTQSQAIDLATRKHLSALTRQAVRSLEEGRTKNPEPEVLRGLATLYGVPFVELLARFIMAFTNW